MISPITRLSKGIFLFFLFTILTARLDAQCNPPDQEPSTDCLGAPLVCLTNACYETLNNPVNCCNGWCGPNTVIHNPEYFQFIPTCPDVVIDIHVDDCDSGNGLQSALLGTCPWENSDVLSCDPGTPPGGTMHLQASGLVVGQIYWLIIDGSGGALCHYTITNTECIFEPGLEGEITEGEANPESVCQGYNALQLDVSPPVGNAHGYYWVIPWLDDTVTTTFPTQTIEVPTDLDPGVYEICARAFSGCDTMDNEVCFEVEVYEIPDEIKPEEYFCPEEFPFNWGSVLIDGPDEYFQTFYDPDGCTYDSSWVVEEYPEVPVGYLDTLHCEESLFYEGMFYDEPGLYDLSYPGQGLNGCDSTAELDVTLAYLDAFIEAHCEDGEFVLEVLVQVVIPANADLEFEWYEGNFSTIVSTEDEYATLDGGQYSVIVEVITDAGSCFFPLEPYTFSAESLRPDPPNMGFLDTLICAQAGVVFEVIVDPFEDPLEYTWSGPANVPIYQDGSSVAEFDFSNAGPSEICVYATNECGDGPPTCFNVDILPLPIASFTYEPAVCTDSTTVVTFTGAASVNAEVIWDFDSPTTLVGTGIGPYTVSWAIPGDKVVTLTVIEPGCDTAFFSQTITVSSFIAPLVNCTSTIDSVHFEWDDVVGATGYLVSIDGGTATPTSLSEWSVNGLLPGTDVNMVLTVVSGGPCEDIIVTAMCTAEDCPAPTMVLSGQDSACLNNPTLIDLEALVNGNNEPGVWTGNGIVDAAQGIFDPKVAGPGIHPITFTVTLNACDFSAPYSIAVFDSLTADFVLDPLICETDAAGVTYTGNASGTSATFDWNFGSATVLAGSGVGPYQLEWASPGNHTVRLQVSENGCFSEFVTHAIDVIAELNPPVINCSPNTSGILFSWTVDPLAADHVVNTLIGPAGNPVGTDSLEFTGLVPGDQVQIEIITISAGPCPDRRDTLLCIARQCPTPIITITPVQDICLYPGTAPIDLEVTITNGAGSGVWSGPGITNPTTGIFDPVLAGPGAHQITFTYTDDGCVFVVPITINVYAVPDAFISNTDLMITCATGSIILDGSSSSGGPLNYQWSTQTGVIDNGFQTALAEVTAQGVYQLYVENATSGCADSTSVTVTQDANIPIADAGPDQTITCTDLVFTLGGNSTTGVNITYNWTTPDGNIIGPRNESTVQADEVGEYNLIVRDTANGCQATDRALVDIDTATATVTLIPGDTIDCNTPISTVTSTNSGTVSDYSYTWSTVDGTIEGPIDGQSINVSQGGTYTLTIVQNDNGCDYTADAIVPESDEIIDAVDASVTHVQCFGDDNGAITINSVTGGITPYDYAWSGTSQTGSELTNLGPGTYTLTVSDQNGCSFVESYQVIEPELVTVSVGPDLTVRITDSVIISLVTSLSPGAVGAIDWSSSNTTISCPGCMTIEFVASNSTTITAMIVDTSGCDATDSMRLTVIVPKIYYIPNVFSPNDDDKNDMFTIWGRFNLVNIGYLRIFDRWGNQLFENADFPPNDPQEGWNGKFKEEFMLPGVYVYTAKLDFEDGTSEYVSGDITIIR